jgi:hypothetical protein
MVPVGGLNASAPRRTTSFFMIAAVLLFVVSIGAAGGMYFWKSYLESAQLKYKDQLAQREKQFNPDLIEELKRQNVKIDLGKQLISNHVAISQVFDIIGRLTIESVRFTSMDLASGATPADGIKINMKGYGTNLSAVAWQSDVLGQLEKYGLRKVVKNPILSDPALDSAGLVTFGFTASIDPSNLSYEKSLATPDSTTSNASTTP